MSTEQQPAVDADALSKATEQLIETLPASNAASEPAKTQDQAPALANEDDDDREYREAHEALKAGENPPSAPEKPIDDPAAALPTPKPGAAPAAPPQGADKGQAPIMIPKARFDEVLRERDQATNQAAYLKGIIDTQKEMRAAPAAAQTPAQPAQPVKTPDQILSDLDAQRIDVAKKYDEGEITFSEWRKQDGDLSRQEVAFRSELNKVDMDRVRQEAAQAARNEVQGERLDEHATRVETQHPGLLQMPKDPDHPRWALLREEAAQSLASEGVKLIDGDPRSLQVFRERIGELSDKYLPIWTGQPLPAAGASPTPQPVPGAPAKPSVAQQRAAKIAVAHQQPPDTGRMGASGTRPELTDAQITGMSDDEIAALPDATRARVKGTV